MKHIKNKTIGALLSLSFACSVSADDLEIYAGETLEVSSPVELLFAVDTSTSMFCNVGNTSDCYEDFFGDTRQSKAHLVSRVLSRLISDEALVPDETRVGLAYYNDPGGAIVQPLKELSAEIASAQYPSHRSLLVEEVESIIPGGNTPILGTLLEIGQYLTSAPVLSGLSRKPTPFLGLDVREYDEDDVLPFGQTSRASHPETILTGSGVFDRSADCNSSLQADLVEGQFSESCVTERHMNSGSTPVTYNEDVNSASVCTASDELSNTRVTTQVVLLTDGLPALERMSVIVNDGDGVSGREVRMGTWVKRFVSGDQSALGFLNPGEGVTNDSDFAFQDLGCPITANAVTEMRRVRVEGENGEGVPPFILDLLANVPSYENIISGRFINLDQDENFVLDLESDSLLSPTDLLIPSIDEQMAQYHSCLYNIALRFRELGVKIHVVGFDVEGNGVENEILENIATITGGEWRSTTNADELLEFFSGLAVSGVKSAKVSATLAPSVSVNPGSILSNADEVYFPMFKSEASSFLYGNLKKYRIEEVNGVAAIVDASGNVATEVCEKYDDNNDLIGEYVCFRESSRSIWSDVADGDIVTRGGAASNQPVYGLSPDGGRRVYIQVDDENLAELNLLSLAEADESLSLPVNIQPVGDPDGSALLVSAAQTTSATRDYYARLVPIPGGEGETFENYATLNSHDQAESLNHDVSAYNMLRWLVGYDVARFNLDGAFDPDAAANGTGQTERDLLNQANAQAEAGGIPEDQRPEPLAPVVSGGSDLELSRLYLGAIVHSQPTVVNYAVEENPDGTYRYDNAVFISGNDGFLRIIDSDSGEELSAFYPSALVDNIPAMYENREGSLSYGLDSTWTAWRQDLPNSGNGPNAGVMDRKIATIPGKGFSSADSDGFVRLYGGMRRGGRSYYFMDVTDRREPVLIKEIQGGDVNNDSDEFSRMGQTWSQPTLAKIKQGERVQSVAIFGGGYDPDYDFDEPGQANGPCADVVDSDTGSVNRITCGNQIYVVRAGGYSSRTDYADIRGDDLVVWWASDSGSASSRHAVVSNMNHSIPSKVKTLDVDGDGLTDRVYVGDLGGQVFRVDINHEGSDSVFSIVTLIQAGSEGIDSSTEADNRVFFEAPSVAVMRNGLGNRYVGVALASGWRENPKDRIVNDEMYFIRDNLGDEWTTLQRPAVSDDSQFGTADFITHVENISSAPSGIQQAFDTARVISVGLSEEGEKAFGSPIILFGNVFWPTYIPPTLEEITDSETSCEPPPQRSRVSFTRVQSGSPDLIYNNDGVITKSDARTPSDMPVVYHTEPELSVPLSGLGVHVSNDQISVLAGSKALSIQLDDETVRKTTWRIDSTGKDAIPDNPVRRPSS